MFGVLVGRFWRKRGVADRSACALSCADNAELPNISSGPRLQQATQTRYSWTKETHRLVLDGSWSFAFEKGGVSWLDGLRSKGDAAEGGPAETKTRFARVEHVLPFRSADLSLSSAFSPSHLFAHVGQERARSRTWFCIDDRISAEGSVDDPSLQQQRTTTTSTPTTADDKPKKTPSLLFTSHASPKPTPQSRPSLTMSSTRKNPHPSLTFNIPTGGSPARFMSVDAAPPALRVHVQ